MRLLILLLAAALAGGCRAPSETIAPERLPTPIGEVYLPVYPNQAPHSVRLTVRALIDVNGAVASAQISPPSGSALWDSLAAVAVHSWRFAPARQNDRAVPVWINFPVTLQFADPHPVSLAEIVVPTRRLADSVYALLRDGHDFGDLARSISTGSTAPNAGSLGPRPLKDFPVHVQMAVTSIGAGQVTPPVLVGESFVIYKRLQDASRAGRMP